ncbi:Ig-like domain-containing protein [Ravibacter arvi]|uniref:Ig-like domain-containing protein n=1 Tax=Ravibacter arvi TaxID=2051041 RepID=A0ABP8M985_9BACT
MNRLAALILASLVCFQCAQKVAPTGGKKDEIPPKLVASHPVNKATNFKENVITLTFDEYVVIDNLMQKLIITPETDNTYTPLVKNETVILKFKKPFADSTTYTLNFGDGIKDQAERNPAQNLKLVFGTGALIDSGRVYGTVKDIRTNQPVFDALVGLYRLSDTLTPERIKPYYFSKTDSSGRFSIENTQLANYLLIALTDKNKNLLYNPKDESIAFIDTIVQVKSDTNNYQLSLFHSDVTEPKIQRTIPKVNDYTLVFNKGMDSAAVDFHQGPNLHYQLESPTQLKFYNIPAQTDTIRASITVRDSLGYELTFDQKIMFLPQRGKEKQPSPTSIKNTPPTSEAIEPLLNLELALSKPILNFDSTMLTITADSMITVAQQNTSFTWNRDRTLLKLKAATEAKDSVVIRIAKGAFISIENDSIPATTYKYNILKPADFGIIRGTVQNPSGRSFFIELLDKDFKNVISEVNTSPFVFRNIKPGNYRMRLILDDNRNGRWDTGNFKRKQQPEKILVYPSELIIKSNFEYEENYFTIPSR